MTGEATVSEAATLSARSVVASTLLGTDPPRLPGRLLVAFGEEFGINPGTTRVALSRMVERGELRRDDDGVHELTGRLLERRQRQAAGLAPVVHEWDGSWELHVVRPGSRTSADRGLLRAAGRHLGLGEHRDGVWLRPANLDPDRLPSAHAVLAAQTDSFTADPDGDPGALLAEVFDLDGWAVRAEALDAEMAAVVDGLEGEGAPDLASGFVLAADVLRHLVADPLLPPALEPGWWPAERLRRTHGRYDRAYREQLRRFFRTRRHAA